MSKKSFGDPRLPGGPTSVTKDALSIDRRDFLRLTGLTAAAASVTGAVGCADPDEVLGVGNLSQAQEESDGIQTVAFRPDDQLFVLFRFGGLVLDEEANSLALADADKPGLVSIYFAPQHVFEQSLLEEADEVGDPAPPSSPPRPVNTRLSETSVLVFEVPAEQAPIEYTLSSVLHACRSFRLRVHPNALERVGRLRRKTPPLVVPAPGSPLSARRAGQALGTAGVVHTGQPAIPYYEPAIPVDRTATRLELPYRLLISPNERAAWDHAEVAVEDADSKRVELWHTRMGLRGDDGRFNARETAGRDIRALWTRDSDGLPAPGLDGPLSVSDREQLVTQTSDFSGDVVPKPVQVNKLMLSSFGGWLDVQGDWSEYGTKVKLKAWEHRATLGRDHYVKVVKNGYLYPFGHRASLVKITERKFRKADNWASNPGNAPYLWKRYFLIVLEPVKTYDTDVRAAPFTMIRVLDTTTPNLSDVDEDEAFIPRVKGVAYRFPVEATDRAGRTVTFDAGVAWMPVGEGNKGRAKDIYDKAMDIVDEDTKVSSNRIDTKIALADSAELDDTTFPVSTLTFHDVPTADEAGFGAGLAEAEVQLDSVAQLGGGTGFTTFKHATPYLDSGFDDVANAGQVFLEALDSAAAGVDFSGNTSSGGGFAVPGLNIGGISRLAGPINDIANFATGKFDPAEFLNIDAKLFGVLALTDIITGVTGGTGFLDNAPKFISESVDIVEDVIQIVTNLPAYLEQFVEEQKARLQKVRDDLEQRVAGYEAEIKKLIEQGKHELAAREKQALDLIGEVQTRALEERDKYTALLEGKLEQAYKFAQAIKAAFDEASSKGIDHLLTAFTNELEQADVPAVLAAAIKAIEELEASPVPIKVPGKDELLRIKDYGEEIKDKADRVIGYKEQALAYAADIDESIKRELLARFRQLRKILDNEFDDLLRRFQDGQELLKNLTVRLEWKPQIEGDSLGIFAPHDPKGFRVLVEARTKELSPDKPAGVDVLASLENFDIQLLGEDPYISLQFKKLQFRALSGKKPEIDVVFGDLRFGNVLSFVNKLMDIVPLDGFSDPPNVDVSKDGIEGYFTLPIPDLALGIFALQNLSLSAGFKIPFIGPPMTVNFDFCRREQPFTLTVSALGGGGYFGIELSMRGLQRLEAALEFGASLSIDLGVASGGVCIMGGVMFSMELMDNGDDMETTLSGYLRIAGYVDVLGLISASIELRMDLAYETKSGKVVGTATIEVEINILFFSKTVRIRAERRFAGSNEDPTFADLMLPQMGGTPASDPTHPWYQYVNAFYAKAA